ncbi:M23 family metallopeptidase [Pueribacillus sp. YX66]|uniref:M23 family metallopeptidase n=1 Tax=Pueribacillus sp. YX66 TaxID=3229242 RepID=UPI00358D3E9B
MLDHGRGVETRYAHLSSITVTHGESINVGQVIGRIGSTGSSTNDHFHFEVRNSSSPYNLLSFFE